MLHHQVALTGGQSADVVELANIGMIQGGHSTRFPLKTLAELLVSQFDGHGAIEASVSRLIYRTHAAGADGRQYFVRTQSVASREGHEIGPTIVHYFN